MEVSETNEEGMNVVKLIHRYRMHSMNFKFNYEMKCANAALN